MTFFQRLQLLGFASYRAYLASSKWKEFKEKYKRSGARMTCLVCGKTPIQLHHRNYRRLGCERPIDVDPLCSGHHKAVHDWLKKTGKISVKFTDEALRALGHTRAKKIAKQIRRLERAEIRRMQRKYRPKGSAITLPSPGKPRKCCASAKRTPHQPNCRHAIEEATRERLASKPILPRVSPPFQPNAKARVDCGSGHWHSYLQKRKKVESQPQPIDELSPTCGRQPLPVGS